MLPPDVIQSFGITRHYLCAIKRKDYGHTNETFRENYRFDQRYLHFAPIDKEKLLLMR